MSSRSRRAIRTAALSFLVLVAPTFGFAAGTSLFDLVDEVETPGIPASGVSIAFAGSHVYLATPSEIRFSPSSAISSRAS